MTTQPALRHALAASVAVLTLALGACTSAPPADPGEGPAALEPVPGSDVKKVTLTSDAVSAIGLQTGTVSAGPTTGQLSIPYAAVLYYTDGTSWTYTSPAPREFVRVPVTIASIDGGLATLTAGPAVGTSVVVLGAPEVLGAELEISGEQ